jgi:YVTN family beta-propeller protein
MTDIVGSTDHAAELGDSGWRELVQQHHRVIRAALRRHGGREIDTAGDGFFAILDAPAAAVRCALEIVDEIKQLGVEVRIGIHVGEVEQIGRKVGGISVVIASRIMSLAGPGEVLVSSTVRDLVAGSRLTFDDRGTRELKGVPGEWHVYAVTKTEPEAVETAGATVARELRASAVRRAGARPIWQRRPRLVAAAVVGLAIVLATTGLLVWKPWQTPALASVAENSVAVIDVGRSEVVRQIRVGTSPGGIAFDEDYAWVTNTGDDTVSRIDRTTRAVVNRIEVGRAPKGIVIAEGSLWVANSGERTVSRINVDTDDVTQTIEVGNGPTAVAATHGLVWVANATDSTVVSIDARTGAVSQPKGVGARPVALAADEGGLWVMSEDAAALSQLDPVTGVATAAPIQLVTRPGAFALDATSVWVASVDGTVTRIDRATGRVIETIDVGGNLGAVVLGGTSVWVGDHEGNVYRLDTDNSASLPRRISTSSAVTALAAVDGEIWLAAQASLASHRGGTLRIVEWEPPRYTDFGGLPVYASDPLWYNAFFNAIPLQADGLVGYRHVGGSAGSVLLPDLATSVPRPTNGGLTYTFQLRPDLLYSTGKPVRPDDFRRAMERSFQVPMPYFARSPFESIQGASECVINNYETLIERCDLVASGGIVTDDATNTITFNLSAPDPEFVHKLTTQIAYPVPEGVPMNEPLVGEAFPGTGPYALTSMTDTEVRLARNAHFQVWDPAVRPDGYPDEIVFTLVEDDAQRVGMVENGEADYTSYRIPRIVGRSPELYSRIESQYPGQWHVGSVGTHYFQLNVSLPPFNNLEARQALNLAIDRATVAGLPATPGAAVTCQLLPPGWPGYQPYCPYTVDPDEGGRWKGPNLEEARRLAEVSGTLTVPVVVGPAAPLFTDKLEYVASVLEGLGYEHVSIDDRADESPAWESGLMQVSFTGWGADWVTAGNFLGLLRCPEAGGDQIINYCNQDFDDAFEHALELQATDPAAANREWAALDRWAVDEALMVPISNDGADFVSARVGNYQFSPNGGTVLFDQMWVH